MSLSGTGAVSVNASGYHNPVCQRSAVSFDSPPRGSVIHLNRNVMAGVVPPEGADLAEWQAAEIVELRRQLQEKDNEMVRSQARAAAEARFNASTTSPRMRERSGMPRVVTCI